MRQNMDGGWGGLGNPGFRGLQPGLLLPGALGGLIGSDGQRVCARLAKPQAADEERGQG